MSTNDINTEKFRLQDEEYIFPYHYIPYMESNHVVLYRQHRYGYEYFCYLLHINEIVQRLSPNSLLDVGCGDGFFINQVVRNVNCVKGVDLSERGIAFAKAFNSGNAKFECVDAANLNETYDVVVAIEVLEHIPDEYVKTFLQTLFERVRDGGTVIICVPSKNVPLTPKHYRHYDFTLFRQQLLDSGIAADIVSHDYICKENKILNKFLEYTHNRLLIINARWLHKKIWKCYYKRLRYADESNSGHLVITLTKKI